MIPGMSKEESEELEQQIQLNLATRHAAASPEIRKLLDTYGWTHEAIERHMEEFHKVMWRHHLETFHMFWLCQCAACKEEQRRIPNYDKIRRRILGKS